MELRTLVKQTPSKEIPEDLRDLITTATAPTQNSSVRKLYAELIELRANRWLINHGSHRRVELAPIQTALCSDEPRIASEKIIGLLSEAVEA